MQRVVVLMSRILRGDRDRGAALVEFASITPLLLVLVFGIVEMGLAFRDRLTVSSAVQSATRIGSVLGTDAESDFATLQAITAGLNGQLNPGNILEVFIYRSDETGAFIASDANRYVYDPADLTCPWDPCPLPGAGFEAYGSPENWVPADRDTSLPNPDILGVRVVFQHDWITTILPFMQTPAQWTDDARIRLEPDLFGGP